MENNTAPPQQDSGKTVAILSYCTLIGFIIALVMNGDQNNKSELGVFHIRQGLGIFLTSFCIGFASIILMFIPILGWLAIMGAYITLFVFWIMGLIAAINGEKKVVPLLGDFYQKLFNGIK
ncbi:MAG: hypothetical protein COB15_17325 [Flavobacteriales bacterium]|nr:MAG: hypothetical protein COB15_17325 [Flavobacteriales bacterium]